MVPPSWTSWGKIKTKKGVNVPGVHLSMPYLSQRDRDDIIFGVQQGFDFIAASFVRTAQDVYYQYRKWRNSMAHFPVYGT